MSNARKLANLLGTSTTVPSSKMPTGSVLQAQSFERTTYFEQPTQGSMIDCGVSVNITPISSSNKILVLVSGVLGNDTAGNTALIHLLRDSTKIAVGTSSSTTDYNASAFSLGSAVYETNHFGINHLDSPATTNQITYKLQIGAFNGDAFIGSRGDNPAAQSIPTNITVMEIAG